MKQVNIIGAGLAGLSAAILLAENGTPSALISRQPSERAQSVLAEGGINAALNVMGMDDSPSLHRADTLRAGCDIADEEMVRGLTDAAPEIVRWLQRLGVPFNTQENGELVQRYFGGQKKPRTAFARSSTGKMIMTALIDRARYFEAKGLIRRYSRHRLIRLSIRDGICAGVCIMDEYTGKTLTLDGSVLLACGGLNGLFPRHTTGTTQNSAEAAALAFAQGVRFSNLEMLQYHPTTVGIAGKCCLVSEAARGEGGRLYVERGGERWYFMEEKYPEMGNLMPRDVVSREMWHVLRDPACGDIVYLDMTGVPDKVWDDRLSDLRDELQHYLGVDAKKTPVPVEPGIHYFMGGIDVDASHRTNIRGLYAAGECCSAYHGANRLGANSMLGAIYGGKTAARTLLREEETDRQAELFPAEPEVGGAFTQKLGETLYAALGIVRDGAEMEAALEKVRTLGAGNAAEERQKRLGEAMLLSALYRKESRGAHCRLDFPERREAWRGVTTAESSDGEIRIGFRKAGEKAC